MKLMCIFHGNKLLEYRTGLNAERSYEYKENVYTITHIPVEDLTAVMFEDEEIDEYLKAPSYIPKKSIEISREKVSLFKVEQQPTTISHKLKWMDCPDADLSKYFTEDEILKIQANKAYYASLGPEKYVAGYAFEWPHIIPDKTVEVETTAPTRVLHKEIFGVVLEDIIPESEE